MTTNITTTLPVLPSQPRDAKAPADTQAAVVVPDESNAVSQGQDPAVAGRVVPPEAPRVSDAPRPDRSQVESATAELSDFVQSVSRSLQISVDEELGDTVIRVLDRETEELVRQIPAEELLEIARFLRERSSEVSADEAALKGLLLDSNRGT